MFLRGPRKIIDAQALVLLRDHLTIPLLGLVGAFGNVLEQTEMDIGKITKVSEMLATCS